MATDKQLKKAATELNDVMGLTPAINVKGDVDTLTKGIKAAMKHITPEDEFSETTQEVIDEYTAKPAKAAAAPAAKKKAVVVEDDDDDDDDDDDEPEVPAKKGKKAPVIVEDDDADDDDEPEVPAKKKKAAPAPEPPAKKKAAPVIVEDDDDDDDDDAASLEDQITEGSLEELKALVKSNPIFKSLKKELANYAKAGALRKAMTALLPDDDDDDDDDDEPVSKKKAAPAEKKEKGKAFVRLEFNRLDCVLITLQTKKPKTMEDWITKANAMYVAKGGKDNEKQTKHLVQNYGASLKHLTLDVKVPSK